MLLLFFSFSSSSIKFSFLSFSTNPKLSLSIQKTMNNSSQIPSSASFGYIYGEQNWQDVVDQTDKKPYSNPQTSVGMVSLASISPPDSEFSMDTPNLHTTSWNTQDTYSVDGSIRDPAEDGSPLNEAPGDLEDR